MHSHSVAPSLAQTLYLPGLNQPRLVCTRTRSQMKKPAQKHSVAQSEIRDFLAKMSQASRTCGICHVGANFLRGNDSERSKGCLRCSIPNTVFPVTPHFPDFVKHVNRALGTTDVLCLLCNQVHSITRGIRVPQN